MECPHCKHELRLAEAVPTALEGAFAYVKCPRERCAQPLVAHIVTAAPALMTVRDGHRLAAAHVRATSVADRIVVAIACVGAFGFGLFLALWEFLIPSEASRGSAIAYAIFLGLGPFTTVAMVGGLLLDEMLGREKWRASLPHVTLVFGTTPDAYRQ